MKRFFSDIIRLPTAGLNDLTFSCRPVLWHLPRASPSTIPHCEEKWKGVLMNQYTLAEAMTDK